MHRRTVRRIGLLAVEHERQPLVVDAHQLGGVLRARAAVGNDGGHPLAGVARHIDGERAPLHVQRIKARHQRLRRRRKLAAIEHVMYPWQRQCRGLVDRDDARSRIGAGHQRDMAGAGQGNVGREAALAHHKASILAHPAVGRNEAEFGRRAHGSPAGRLRPRMRSAASAIASTIWA